MILGSQGPGKIGRRQIIQTIAPLAWFCRRGDCASGVIQSLASDKSALRAGVLHGALKKRAKDRVER